MSAIPESPDAVLDRKAAAAALTEAGFRTASSTLATLACRGGGPPYRLFARKPIYKWSDALEWAVNRTSAPASSSAEHGLQSSAHEVPAAVVA
jgi:hypothetical protein